MTTTPMPGWAALTLKALDDKVAAGPWSMMRTVLAAVAFPPWVIALRYDDGRPYLQVQDPNAVCNATGKPAPWSGRKWFLSLHMTETELVKTALKAVLAAVEHEALERFTYKGVTVFDPHIRVDDLVELRAVCPLDARAPQ
ncbi:hypothetical protein GIW81_00950 [Hyphomicrobium sp. xq]|uniref:Uncharacterized protein n=1 Tax=Hyphomicrobium album TaxID=2665159 RepID=A0A6I3KFE3_9HYPH|nr:hypothetical protein [Hyphomicrobium album]MTD92896.1 hypothetical protein [Hyphomicrobium album]